MSSPTPTAPNDTLPSSVPKLDPTGTNWSIFLIRFTQAMAARRKWGHFSGTTKKPMLSTTPTTVELENLEEWQKDEDMAMYMLSQKLPDSALVRVYKLSSAEEAWKMITQEYTRKGVFARADLRKR